MKSLRAHFKSIIGTKLSDTTYDALDQLVVIISNNSNWYGKVGKYIDKNFDKFRIESNHWRAINGHEMSDHGLPTGIPIRYLNIALWEKYSNSQFSKDTPQINTSGYVDYLRFLRNVEIPSEPISPITEENPMTGTQTQISTPAFETRHFVFGVDIRNMNETDLIGAVKRIETEIADLKTVGVKSERIKSKIDELKDMLDKIVEVLDGKLK